MELEQKESVTTGSKADFAKRVAYDLLAFVQSFGHQLPVELVEQWFKKFMHKFSCDPDFLTRKKEAV